LLAVSLQNEADGSVTFACDELGLAVNGPDGASAWQELLEAAGLDKRFLMEHSRELHGTLKSRLAIYSGRYSFVLPAE